jgi:hypothetical protein
MGIFRAALSHQGETMTYEILKPYLALLVRHGLTAMAGFLVTHGVINDSGTQEFIGAGMAAAGVAWSWWEKYGRAAVAADIANLRVILAARAAAARAGAPTTPLPSLQPGGTVPVPPQAVAPPAAKIG